MGTKQLVLYWFSKLLPCVFSQLKLERSLIFLVPKRLQRRSPRGAGGGFSAAAFSLGVRRLTRDERRTHAFVARTAGANSRRLPDRSCRADPGPRPVARGPRLPVDRGPSPTAVGLFVGGEQRPTVL